MKTDATLPQDVMAVLTGAHRSKDQAIEYDASLKVDNLLMVAHGSAADQDKARSVLAQARTAVAAE